MVVFWQCMGASGPIVTLDLRILQPPRGGGSHRQGEDEDEGKDR